MNDLDPRLRHLAERALARIPVPDAPATGTSQRGSPGVVVVAVTTLVIVIAALGTGRFLSELREDRAAATPPARPTAAAGHVISPLAIVHRNTRYGYNLLFPGSFRRSEAETPLETLWARRPELDSREIFTARIPEEERRYAGAPVLPWDLIVEVYERKGASLDTWAEWLGCSWIGQPPPGTAPCTLDHTTLSGAPAVVGTSGKPLPGKMYLVDRGEQLLVLRYGLGTESNRPQDVSEAVLEQIVHSLGLVGPAPVAVAAPRVTTAADVWPYLRATVPSAPMPEPRWLPDTIDRAHVTVSGVVSDPSDPRYVVTYTAPKGTLVLALGPADEIAGSGYGMHVRGQAATLTFASSLFSDPGAAAPRRVRWRENGHTLSLTSETFTGDDLLHVAWSLDLADAPLRPFTRAADGVCAKAGGTPEDTVRAYITFLAGGTGDELADCYADEVLGGADAPPMDPSARSPLPRTTIDDVHATGTVAGRRIIAASWTFASDPGGTWGMRAGRFFTLALESGRWRITEIASAPTGPPP